MKGETSHPPALWTNVIVFCCVPALETWRHTLMQIPSLFVLMTDYMQLANLMKAQLVLFGRLMNPACFLMVLCSFSQYFQRDNLTMKVWISTFHWETKDDLYHIYCKCHPIIYITSLTKGCVVLQNNFWLKCVLVSQGFAVFWHPCQPMSFLRHLTCCFFFFCSLSAHFISNCKCQRTLTCQEQSPPRALRRGSLLPQVRQGTEHKHRL